MWNVARKISLSRNAFALSYNTSAVMPLDMAMASGQPIQQSLCRTFSTNDKPGCYSVGASGSPEFFGMDVPDGCIVDLSGDYL
jgi:hypothetical protein